MYTDTRHQSVPMEMGIAMLLRVGMRTLADFLDGGDFGNPSELSERALRGSGLTGEGFGSRRGTKRHRNNLSHAHNNNMKQAAAPGGVTSHPSHPPRSSPREVM